MSLARISLALSLGVACAPPAAVIGQRCDASAGDAGAARRAIQALEELIGSANFDCDYKFFAEVEAPEFIYTDARGNVTTRAQDLAGESNCRPQKGTYVLDEVRFQLHGSVAVYSARATTTVMREGAPIPPRINRFTDVLVWRDCQWRLVSGHSSRIS
jgi:hypothetical protein